MYVCQTIYAQILTPMECMHACMYASSLDDGRVFECVGGQRGLQLAHQLAEAAVLEQTDTC